MNRPGQYVVAAVLGIAVPLACLDACSSDRGEITNGPVTFPPDASLPDAPDCRLQCSLDGRTVIEACTGTVVETCPDHLACGGAKCIEPCAAAAEDRSSNGCDFYLQSPQFMKRLPPSCYAAFVVNTSNQPVELSLELQGQAVDVSNAIFRTQPGSAELEQHTGAIPAGESVVVFLSNASPDMPRTLEWQLSQEDCPAGVVPATFDRALTGGTGIGSSFHLKSNAPVSLSTIYPFGGAASYVPTATLVFPVASWTKEHILVNGWEASETGSPAVQIVASEDATEITIVPTRDIQDGVGVKGGRAGRPVKYTLDKGQFLRIVQDEELTGSIITSTKPTTTIGANSCAYVPSAIGTCDVLAQQIPGFEQWGSEYVGVAYRPRLGNEHEPVPYRIVAARDGTMLDYDPEIPPGAPTTLNAGESATFVQGTGDAFVVRTQSSDHPIYVAAHMTGSSGDVFGQKSFAGIGDPEFVNVVPAHQYMNAYSFYADPTYGETSLVVVRAKLRDKFEDVWLECAGNLTGWKPIGTRGDYEYVRVDLAKGGREGEKFGESTCKNGLQRMKSVGPFTATLWGWDNAASYAYPGGMAQRKLVEVPLTID